MRLQFSVLLTLLLSSSTSVIPAYCQGLMENTSVQGTAAGLGGGLGASAFKLFNGNNGTAAASNVNKTVQASEKTVTPAEVKAKSARLSADAKASADAGDLAGAAKKWQELAKYRQIAVGKNDLLAGNAYQNAGSALLKTKMYSQAEDSFKMALGYSNRINGADSPKSLPILVDLANSLKEQDRATEAIPYYKQAISLEEKSSSPSSSDLKSAFLTKANLGDAYFKAGTYAEAEPLLKQSVELARKNNFYNNDELSSLLKTYATTLQKNNKVDEAEQVSNSIKAIEQANPGGTH